MSKERAFLISEKSAVELAKGKPTWQIILREGDWSDSYKQFAITEQTIDDFIRNYNANVLQLEPNELQVNYGHTPYAEAAGWISKLRKGTDEKGRIVCEAFMRFTSTAKSKIKDEEYRWFSAEMDFLYEDPESNEKFKNVLLGAALTNIPFIPDLGQIKLSKDKKSEIHFYSLLKPDMKTFLTMLSSLKEKDSVSPSEFEMLKTGLTTLSDEDQEKVKDDMAEVEEKVEEETEETPEEKAAREAEEKAAAEEGDATEKELSRIQALSKKKTLTSEDAKEVLGLVESMSKNLSALQSDNQKLLAKARKTEEEARLDKLVEAGKITPAQKITLSTTLCNLSKEKANSIYETFKANSVQVDLDTEKGSDKETNLSKEEKASKHFLDFKKEYLKENKGEGTREALNAFRAEHPEEAKLVQ